MPSMTRKEKTLYHQIHPLKLLTDWSSATAALFLLWHKHLLAALFVAFVPPPIVSFLLICYADLEKYRQSSFGRYLHRYMTRATEGVRLAGFILMAVGAWYHIVWLIPAGFLVVLLAWLRGLLFPSRAQNP